MDQRVIELEIKVMHLERTVEELNQVVIEQGKREEALVGRLGRLERQMAALLEHLDGG